MGQNSIASVIDHTLLKPESTKEQIETLCHEAKMYRFKAVCINPTWVKVASDLLKNTEVEVATVIGFPLGATKTETKVKEAEIALEDGATELDMVINIGALKSGEETVVKEDIAKVVQATKGRALVKVIIETGLLTDDEKRLACTLAKEAGADFVKTSTGFGQGGATVEDVKLMREVVGSALGVKASGGIRTLNDARAMLEAGASRIGASSGVQIVSGEKKK